MMKSSTGRSNRGADFQIYTTVDFFEKSDAPEGERRRVAGVITTDSLDKDEEIVIQKSLNFTDFIREGWLNDNHSQKQTDNVGYPLEVQYFDKGAKLPNGAVAKANCHWMEAVLLEDYPLADQIWKLGKALSKTKARKLGYSIEGKILKRAGSNGKVIASANVKNVAITHCPANPDTYMITLAKNLLKAEQEEYVDQIPGGKADDKKPSDFEEDDLKDGRQHEMEHTNSRALATEIAMDHLVEDEDYYDKLKQMEAKKTLSVGAKPNEGVGSKPVEGDGTALTRESLDGTVSVQCEPDDIQKAYKYFTNKYPGLPGNTFHRLISLTGALKRAGVL